jgi:hypothetical protein
VCEIVVGHNVEYGGGGVAGLALISFLSVLALLHEIVVYHSVGIDLFSLLLYVRLSLLNTPVRGTVP